MFVFIHFVYKKMDIQFHEEEAYNIKKKYERKKGEQFYFAASKWYIYLEF